MGMRMGMITSSCSITSSVCFNQPHQDPIFSTLIYVLTQSTFTMKLTMKEIWSYPGKLSYYIQSCECYVNFRLTFLTGELSYFTFILCLTWHVKLWIKEQNLKLSFGPFWLENSHISGLVSVCLSFLSL